MKKSIILAAIALSFGLTACNQQKKVKAEMPTAEMQEEPVPANTKAMTVESQSL